jgi:hypothetical protein
MQCHPNPNPFTHALWKIQCLLTQYTFCTKRCMRYMYLHVASQYMYMYVLPLCSEVKRVSCVFETNAVNIVAISAFENIRVSCVSSVSRWTTWVVMGRVAYTQRHTYHTFLRTYVTRSTK